MSKARDNYWDFIKGLAIVGVVSIHFIGSGAGDCWTFLIRQFASMAVFVFIFLAGYFTNVNPCVGKEILNYYQHRCWRLALPYFVWTIGRCLIFCPEEFLSPYRFFIHDLVLGYGIRIGYYVVVLLQLALLSPFLVVGVKRFPLLMLACSAFVSFAMAFIANAAAAGWMGAFGLSVPVPFPAILFTTWIFPFVLGILLRTDVFEFGIRLSNRKGLVLFVALAAFAFQIFEVRWARLHGVVIDAQFGVVGMLCATFWCLVVIIFHRDGLGCSPLVLMGRGSYLIYMTHIVGFGVLFKIMPACFGFGMPVKMLSNYLAGIVLICGLYTAGIWVMGKIPGERWKRWIALK